MEVIYLEELQIPPNYSTNNNTKILYQAWEGWDVKYVLVRCFWCILNAVKATIDLNARVHNYTECYVKVELAIHFQL